jgi:branched-chain amino acid transport system permease protein
MIAREVLRRAALIAALLFIGIVLLRGGYLLTVVGIAAIYAVLVSGLNLFMGLAGQVSFGQNAFAAIGGYATAILTANFNWDPLAAMLVGATAAAALSVVLGYPAMRLTGHTLAMATLSFGLIAYEIAVQWQSVTQGYTGISGIAPLGAFGVPITGERASVIVLLCFAGASLWLAHRLRHSRFGRALLAQSASPEAAGALGIVASRAKLAAFVLAAVHAAVAGSLFADYVGFISPEVFGLSMVVQGFTMLYVGGVGTVAGPLVGAVAIGALPELVRGFARYQDLLYGVLLIVILIYRPSGLASLRGGEAR